ncbi:MAG: tetratricopeptide repeat protein [Thermodesulfobacteriota bacterium]|nr:tetratricopeptide repeat protein [Thermodesulfobacteriota bacterium]
MGDTTHTRKQDRFIICCLIGFILIIYSNTLHVPFVFDDMTAIVERNDLHLRQLSIDTILDTFTRETGNGDIISRPLSNLTFALNFYVGGFQVTGYHLFNITIHMVTAAVLFKVLMLLLALRKDRFPENQRYLIASISVLLWAIHPIQIQAVTYIVQRMASLAAMFYILGVWAYLKFRLSDTRQYRLLGLTALMAMLAVLSKENAVMFPVGILLIEWILFINTRQPIPRIVLPLILGGAVAVVVMLYRIDIVALFDGYQKRPFTLTERLLTQPRVIFFYLYQMLALTPEHYCIDHYFAVSTALLSPPSTIAAIMGVATIIAVAIGMCKHFPFTCFAVLFFLAHHAVESTFLPLELIFEHRNYLPSFFLFLPAGLLINRMLVIYRQRSRFIYVAIALVVSGTFMFIGMCTHVRNYDWQTRETIWTDAAAKYPGITRPYHNLGYVYQRRGAFEKAIETYQIALTKHDHDQRLKKILTLGNLAEIYYHQQKYEKAAATLERAAETASTITATQNALLKVDKKDYGILLSKAYAHTRPALALETVDRLIQFTQTPESLGRLYTLKGRIALYMGNVQDAWNAFQQALKTDPENTWVQLNLGVAATFKGELEQGRRYLELFLADQPNHGPAYLYLAENRLLADQTAAASTLANQYIAEYGIKQLKIFINNIRTHDPDSLPLANPDRMLALLEQELDVYIAALMRGE